MSQPRSLTHCHRCLVILALTLSSRNNFLAKMGKHPPAAKKTGTTIAGCIFKGGVVLGADTRATSGSIVCDKNCEKIHFISKSIWCCGAGTSADTENTTAVVASKLELMRLVTGHEPRVVSAMTRLKQYLFQYQGHVSAALVLGGVDVTGSYLYTVHPHGSVDQLPYATMGSGSLCAMAVFEEGYRDDLTEAEAVELVNQAIQSGIYNDLGSGGNVDICVISQETGVSYILLLTVFLIYNIYYLLNLFILVIPLVIIITYYSLL